LACGSASVHPRRCSSAPLIAAIPLLDYLGWSLSRKVRKAIPEAPSEEMEDVTLAARAVRADIKIIAGARDVTN
jgi:hypothetical protein